MRHGLQPVLAANSKPEKGRRARRKSRCDCKMNISGTRRTASPRGNTDDASCTCHDENGRQQRFAELREFKDALLSLLISCAKQVEIKTETQKDKSEEKQNDHYQHSDNEKPGNSSSRRCASSEQSRGRLLNTIGARIDVSSRSGKRKIEDAESQQSS